MKALRSLLIASVFAFAAVATPARAADESPWKFEFHGFVTGSLFMQDQVFAGGTGQDNILAAPSPANNAPCKTVACQGGTFAAGTATKSGTFLGGDARQSRWIFVMSGPQAFGATPKSYFEGDFLGAPTSPTALNTIESTQARLRAAYGELKWGGTQLQFGQYSAQLILAQLSATVAHIANPITFGTGTIGSRAVGVRLVHTMPLEGLKLELAGELLAPKWNDPPRAAAIGAISQAWASGVPQVGARVKGEGKAGPLGYTLYLAGAFESVDLKGFGKTTPAGVTLQDGSVKTSLSPYAVEVGGQLGFDPVVLNFNAFMGQATGLWAGAINQSGDIADQGYWVQLGVKATPQIAIYGLFGQGMPDKKDIRNWAATPTTASRADNQLIGGILKFSDGGYTFCAEYLAFSTKYISGTNAAPAADIKTDAYQIVLSGHYAF